MDSVEPPVRATESAWWAIPFLVAGSIGALVSVLMFWGGWASTSGDVGRRLVVILMTLLPLAAYALAVRGFFRAWPAWLVALLTIPADVIILLWIF